MVSTSDNYQKIIPRTVKELSFILTDDHMKETFNLIWNKERDFNICLTGLFILGISKKDSSTVEVFINGLMAKYMMASGRLVKKQVVECGKHQKEILILASGLIIKYKDLVYLLLVQVTDIKDNLKIQWRMA